MKNCVEELFYHCDMTTYVTYRALAFLADDICVRFIKYYPRHHDCFLQLYTNIDISKHCIISDLLQNSPSFHSNPMGLATQLCAIGIKYLKCMEYFVSGTCGAEAGAMQKWLVKTIFATTFEDLYCRDVFIKRSWSKSNEFFTKNTSKGSRPSLSFRCFNLATFLNFLAFLNFRIE